MKLPTELFIGPLLIKIKYKKSVKKVNGRGWGYIDRDSAIMDLYDHEGKNIREVWRTIFHEATHVIAEDLKIGGLSDSEGDVHRWSSAWTDFLIRNGILKV